MQVELKKPTAFIIMPFDDELTPVYEQFFKVILEDIGFIVKRADDINHQRNVLKDVVEAIAKSDLIIADLTFLNPNVFYELGLAHALSKPVIMLTQDIDEVPFDLKPYRLLPYSTHFSNIEGAKGKLRNLAQEFKNGSIKFGSPVSDFYTGPPLVQKNDGEEQKHDELEDDRGYLDHIVDLVSGYTELTEIMENITTETKAVGDYTSEATENLAAENENPTEGSISHARKISRRLAERYKNFANNINEENLKYDEIALRTDNSLEFIVTFNKPQNEDDIKDLKEYLIKINDLQESSVDARDAMLNFAKVMDELPKLERLLTKAVRNASVVVKKTADNVDRTISSHNRAIELGNRMLDENNQ